VNDVRRLALANFLRTKRAAISPGEAGIEPGVRRRTPGLRREEVAVLSGVGVTWYTWLEQGRDINASPEVLTGLARVLRLSPPERDYLFRMAGQHPPDQEHLPEAVPSPLIDLVYGLEPSAAFLMDDLWDVQVWNRTAEALLGFAGLPEEDRNIAWMTFTTNRERLADWEGHARRTLAEVRDGFSRRPEAARLGALLARLRAGFPEADAWLDEYEVRVRAGGIVKEIKHPAGTLHLNQLVLIPADAPDLQLVIMQPRDPDTADRLAALSV
jgi:transcriptional regulator with XRE-family HTH domain